MPTPPPSSTLIQTAAGVLLIFGLGLTLPVWGGPSYWTLVFSLAGLLILIRRQVTWRQALAQDGFIVLHLLLLVFLIYSAGSALLYVMHGNRFNLEPLIPFLLFPFLALAVLRLELKQTYFWWGIALGSFGALGIASYQHFGLGIARATGFMNAIPFGDISVVFALAATVGVSSAALRKREHPVLAWVLGAAALCAAYASLLSGSKGGWLSLLTVAALGVVRLVGGLSGPKAGFSAVAVVLVAVLASQAAPRHVFDRVESGIKGGVHWVQTGEVVENSVGYRLEMWLLGLTVFKEHPLIGADRATFLEKKQKYIAQGQFDERLLSQETLDSEWVGALAGGGVLGFVLSLVLIVVPAWAFKRAHARAHDRTRDLALIGVWLPILFFEFGLSISLWGVSAFRQTYVSWLVLIAALMVVEDQRVKIANAAN